MARTSWLAAALMCACTEGDARQQAAPADAAPDSAPDAGADSPTWVGSDATSGDATDAPKDALVGEHWWEANRSQWKPIGLKAGGCEVEYAVDPERAAPPLQWDPCAGVPGCRKFVPMLPPQETLVSTRGVDTPASYRLSVAYHTLSLDFLRVVLYEPGGNISLALQTNNDCTIELALAPSTQCLTIGPFGDMQAAKSLCGSIESLKNDSTPSFAAGLHSDWKMTDSLLALRGGYANSAQVYDLNTNQLDWIAGSSFGSVNTYGDWAFFRVWKQKSGVLWSTNSGESTLVDTAPQYMIDLNYDGERLVWVQSDASDPTSTAPYNDNAALYASPWTEGTSVVPTKLRDLEDVRDSFHSAAGGGMYAFMTFPERVQLYRTSDGRRWLVPPPEDYHLYSRGVLSVNATEFLAPLAPPGVIGADPRPIGLYRQRIDALGPGD